MEVNLLIKHLYKMKPWKSPEASKCLLLLSENNYKRLEYAAYYHQNKVSHGGKITTHFGKGRQAAPVRPYLKGFTLPEDGNHLLFIFSKSKPWRDGV